LEAASFVINEAVHQQVASQTALGRVGQPEEIGGVVAALLSEDTRWINGQKIEVSGGVNL
jgi:NAD(P)-dependent dehydrogenase (short-subunit alcohol dehydrogenase family)